MNKMPLALVGSLLAILLCTTGCRSKVERVTKATTNEPDTMSSPANRAGVSADTSQFSADHSMHFNSTISSATPTGEKLTFEATELVVPKSGRLSEALAKGAGQILHFEGNRQLLLTSGVVTSISGGSLSVEATARKWQFEVNAQTRIGDGVRRFDWRGLKLGDTVTVVSPVTEASRAQSIRKGALLLKLGGLNEASVPVNFECQ